AQVSRSLSTYVASPPQSWPGLSLPSRLGTHCAHLSGMRGSSPRMTAEFGATYLENTLRKLVGQRADAFDPDLGGVAGLEELAARRADAGRRAGQDDVARIERDPRRQVRQLLGQIEDHVAGVGVLLDDVIDPKLDAELLRVLDVACRDDPRADRAGVVEALL